MVHCKKIDQSLIDWRKLKNIEVVLKIKLNESEYKFLDSQNISGQQIIKLWTKFRE